MNTRHATDGAFHQSKFASSPAFSHGLAANLVAMRTRLVEDRADRELIWFLQYLSHQDGGLTAVAETLLTQFADRIGTPSMIASGKKPGEVFTASEVKQIRREIANRRHGDFPLRGEIPLHIRRAMAYRRLDAERNARSYEAPKDDRFELCAAEREEKEINEEADKLPDSYPVQIFLDACLEAAREQSNPQAEPLEEVLCRLCLDPELSVAEHCPWYFSELASALRDYKIQWTNQRSRYINTAVVKAVHETIEYTAKVGGLSLLTGPSNVGARFAARQYCEQNAGSARLVNCPPSNDEASFFRTIGQALGGNFTNYKNVQIRERVESVLQSGEILLVVCSAENLWPQMNLREAFPKRLAWLIDQTEKGARVCIIAGPQFFMQKRACEKSGWKNPEFQHRFGHVAEIPGKLTVNEMAAIAKFVLPETRPDDCEQIALNAIGSKRYLVTVDNIAKRAKFVAERNGRTQQTADDVDEAVKFVNQSETLLRQALEENQKPAACKPGRAPLSSTITPPARTTLAADPVVMFPRRLQSPGDLVPD